MSPASRPSVLFVENNPEVRMLMEELLGETFDLALAAGAEEALSILSSGEQFDLFLLDIRLGEGRNGVELLHLLRDLEPTASVPAVALTTYGMRGDREALLEEGFDGYVSKPFTKAELTAAIGRVLPGQGPLGEGSTGDGPPGQDPPGRASRESGN